jgi:hypothetical protein
MWAVQVRTVGKRVLQHVMACLPATRMEQRDGVVRHRLVPAGLVGVTLGERERAERFS